MGDALLIDDVGTINRTPPELFMPSDILRNDSWRQMNFNPCDPSRSVRISGLLEGFNQIKRLIHQLSCCRGSLRTVTSPQKMPK